MAGPAGVRRAPRSRATLAGMLAALAPDLFHWSSLDVVHKRHLNGYAIRVKAGLVLIDPPHVPENALPELEALGRPRVVILSGRAQERRAKQFQDWYGAKVMAPEGDQKLMRLPVAQYYSDGDTLPGGLKVTTLPNQRTPGESVLFQASSGTLFAGHLVGEPAGMVQMEDRGLYPSFSKAFEAQLALLSIEFDRLLPGRGTPIPTGGRLALAKYLASFGEGGPKGHW